MFAARMLIRSGVVWPARNASNAAIAASYWRFCFSANALLNASSMANSSLSIGVSGTSESSASHVFGPAIPSALSPVSALEIDDVLFGQRPEDPVDPRWPALLSRGPAP